MKYLLPIALCIAAAAHAGIPVTGGLQQVQQQMDGSQKGSQAPLRNEAVRVLPGGRRIVEEPPGPRNGGFRPKTRPSQWNPAFLGASYVIDTATGLKECAWPWLDAGCRDYVPKRDRRERAWVVKYGGRWMTCPHRDSAAGCVGYYEPAATAVQD
jgi:hypothetical protein